MNVGDIITQEELEQQGWTRIISFGDCYIYGKGDERIMWSPITNKVRITFKNGG